MDEMILHIAVAVLPLLAGWILDRLFGDPACLPHPVVGYGKVISFFEHRLNKGSYHFERNSAPQHGNIFHPDLRSLRHP